MSSHLHELLDAIYRRSLPEPTIDLARFAKEETWDQQEGRDRRRFRRYSLITNVIVLPLDGLFRQAGDPFLALSSGMSIDGMRIIHTDPSPTDKLFLAIEGQPVRFVLSVLRSRPIGPCYEIAGRLMSASLVNHEIDAPAHSCVMPDAACGVAIATGTLDRVPPTSEECAHWTGLMAALPLLRQAWPGV